MHIASIGIDLGKTTFHLVALGERNKVLVRKKFSRTQLLAYTANLPASLIGLEACAGAHFLGAALQGQGHQVRLIPAQFVKPYRKSNKNDFIDAEAISRTSWLAWPGRCCPAARTIDTSRCRSPPDWPWKRRCAWKAQNAFHFPTATTTKIEKVPPRSAEERRRRKNSPTACRKTWTLKRVPGDRGI